MALNESEGTQVRKGHHIRACVCDWHDFFFFKFQTSLRLHYMQGKAGGLVES